MESLLEQELKEANGYLLRFDDAHRNYTLFMGGSLVSAAALPVLLIVEWLLGSSSLVKGAIVGSVLVAFGFLLGFWWRQRRERFFREVRGRCLKLQRAGYTVHKKPVFLRNVLAATQESLETDIEVLDFENIDAWDLHYKMI